MSNESERKFIVYEYITGPSTGGRFWSSMPKEGSDLPSHLKIVASGVTSDEALRICGETRDTNLACYMSRNISDFLEILVSLHDDDDEEKEQITE